MKSLRPKKRNFPAPKFTVPFLYTLFGSLLLIFLITIFPPVMRPAIQKQEVPERHASVCVASTPYPTPTVAADFSPTDCVFRGPSRNVSIPGFDFRSCRRLSRYVMSDDTHVYKQLYDPGSSDIADYMVIKEADPRSIKSLGHNYYADAGHVYFDTGKTYRLVDQLDPGTLVVFSSHYVKDKNGLHFADLSRHASVQPLYGFDVSTFHVLTNQNNYENYFADKNGIYFNEDSLVPLDAKAAKISGASAQTFELLPTYQMAKDNTSFYMKGKVIEGADVRTLVYLGPFYRDDKHVYDTLGRVYPGRDGCSFEVLGYKEGYSWRGYSKDAFQVYYQDAVVPGADPGTFQIVGDHAFDKNSSYRGIYKK